MLLPRIPRIQTNIGVIRVKSISVFSVRFFPWLGPSFNTINLSVTEDIAGFAVGVQYPIVTDLQREYH